MRLNSCTCTSPASLDGVPIPIFRAVVGLDDFRLEPIYTSTLSLAT